MYTRFVISDHSEYFLKILEREEKNLLDSLSQSHADSGIQTSIKKALSAWHDYVSAECNAFGQLTQAGESWRHAWSQKCGWRLHEHRYKRVRDAASCVKRSENNSKKYFTATNCLYQILPLNFKGQ